MTKRSVILVGVLILMVALGSTAIGVVSSGAATEVANGTNYIYLPLILKNHSTLPKIAFRTDRDSNDEIYFVYSDGTGETQLTNKPTDDKYHDWSPDGSKLAFSADGELYIMNENGTSQTRLTDSADFFVWECDWSPDGTQITFRASVSGNQEIYIIDADGTDETRLTNNSTADKHPVWSPDGGKIAFVASGEIYSMNPDGTGQTIVTNKTDVYAYEIDWSPDSNQLTFRGEVVPRQDIYVVSSDGTGLTNITDSAVVDLNPKWSPTGTRIAYSCNFEICVIDPDGSNVLELTDNPASDSYPSWSSDGNTIVFASDREGHSDIYRINTDGSGLLRLTTDTGADWLPLWQP